MPAISTSLFSGTQIPARRASSIMANSFSGKRLEAGGGQLDDPRSSHPICRDGQATGGFLDGGEFQLHPGEKKTQRLFAAMAMFVLVALVMMIVMSLGLRLAFKRLNDARAGKVGAEHGEKEEFAFGIHVRARGEIFAQLAFRKKVREERHAAPRGALLVVDVVLLERKKLAVARKAGDNADVFSMQAH